MGGRMKLLGPRIRSRINQIIPLSRANFAEPIFPISATSGESLPASLFSRLGQTVQTGPEKLQIQLSRI